MEQRTHEAAAAFDLAATALTTAAKHLRDGRVTLVRRHQQANPHIRSALEAVNRAVESLEQAVSDGE